MKIALLNNGTHRIAELTEAFATEDATVIVYDGSIDWDYLQSFDAVVLSGSSKHEVHNSWYDAELDFVKHSDKPILGICLGFELICCAYDLPIYQMPERIEGSRQISTVTAYVGVFGHDHTVHEKHKRVTQSVSDEFNTMFISDTGIEGVIHKTRPLLGVQFHPEVIEPNDPNPITAVQLLNYVLNRNQEQSFMTVAKQAASRII